MKRVIGATVVLLCIGCAFIPKSDTQIRQYVYKISGNGVACSGVQVKAPSGNYYILTAGHCRDVLAGNQTTAIDEAGAEFLVDFVAEDPNSDLMLLTSPSHKGLKVAKNTKLHEHLHSITHGGGHATHRADGELLEDEMITVLDHYVVTPEDLLSCMAPKFTPFIQEQEDHTLRMLCLLYVNSTVSTVSIEPGSSGGPVLNANNQLVGIASAIDQYFSFFVTLQDIHTFLKDK